MVGQYLTMMMRVALLALAFFPILFNAAEVALAQAVTPYSPPPVPAEPGSKLTIYLMTMGPGKAVWERFGHNAIWVHDPERGTDKAYNYGLFDLKQQGFLVRFLQGRMWYWMQGFPAQAYVELYRRANRSVWVQELEIPAPARRELQEFLEWNERPENRFYHYDYYRDNCSTRVRDALDRALGGRIRAYAGALPTGKTYRFHTRRLTSNDPLVYTGLLLGLGQPVDREISAWDEMFLPLALRDHMRKVTTRGAGTDEVPVARSERTLFESTGTPPPDRPPFWLLVYLGVGLTIGTGTVLLGRAVRFSSRARTAFLATGITWTLLVGVFGLVLAGLWGLTDHTAAYYNENLLQANPLALVLVWLLPRSTRRGSRPAWMVSAVITGISFVGFVLKAFPAFCQVNGEIIALALPIHLGLAVATWQLHHQRP